MTSSNDMTLEAISCKIAYLMGRGDLNRDEIANLMTVSVRGEGELHFTSLSICCYNLDPHLLVVISYILTIIQSHITMHYLRLHSQQLISAPQEKVDTTTKCSSGVDI